MADHEKSKVESMMKKLADKIHHHHSSSSDSDDDKPHAPSLKSKIYRLFGRNKPVHKVLGAGKPADVFLWRNKKVSGIVLGSATAVWALLEVFEYNLLTLICHLIIVTLMILFLWSNASTFINKSPPRIPEVRIPEGPILELAAALRYEINQGLAVLRGIASGRDLRKFLGAVAILWFISIIGSCFSFLTLFYISFVLLHTLPVFYEKYEDQVDAFAEKAMMEIKKQYAELDKKVISKIPKGSLKDKKLA